MRMTISMLWQDSLRVKTHNFNLDILTLSMMMMIKIERDVKDRFKMLVKVEIIKLNRTRKQTKKKLKPKIVEVERRITEKRESRQGMIRKMIPGVEAREEAVDVDAERTEVDVRIEAVKEEGKIGIRITMVATLDRKRTSIRMIPGLLMKNTNLDLQLENQNIASRMMTQDHRQLDAEEAVASEMTFNKSMIMLKMVIQLKSQISIVKVKTILLMKNRKVKIKLVGDKAEEFVVKEEEEQEEIVAVEVEEGVATKEVVTITKKQELLKNMAFEIFR